jgi:sec-independent protein translocase protein TatA
MNAAVTPMALAGLGTTEILIILGILILLFGAKKLPELARGSGRALRIFKAETKGLIDDNDEPDDKHKTPEQKQIDAAQHTQTTLPNSTVQPSHSDTER